MATYPSGGLTTTLSTGVGQASSASRTYSSSAFIPELWADEVIASYESNLVLANLVKRFPMSGKKGDTIHVPNFALRGSAAVKAGGAAVTTQSMQAEETPVLINKHYEYSFLIEDIVSIQANDAFRAFYTQDAGYALARQVDQDLFLKAAYLQSGSLDTSSTFVSSTGPVIGGDGTTAFDGNTGTSGSANASALTDAGIRKMMQTLDDKDVPMEGRVLVIPPVERKNLLGLARFTEQAFKGDGSAITTGNFGSIYGLQVYVSSNCPWIHVDTDGEEYWTFSSSDPSGTDAFGRTVTYAGSGSKNRVGMLLHRDAIVLAEQQAVRTQTQYKQEYLADLFTADTVYGVEMLRTDNGVAFVVPYS